MAGSAAADLDSAFALAGVGGLGQPQPQDAVLEPRLDPVGVDAARKARWKLP
jgi:hypothetical protein